MVWRFGTVGCKFSLMMVCSLSFLEKQKSVGSIPALFCCLLSTRGGSQSSGSLAHTVITKHILRTGEHHPSSGHNTSRRVDQVRLASPACAYRLGAGGTCAIYMSNQRRGHDARRRGRLCCLSNWGTAPLSWLSRLQCAGRPSSA